MDGFPNAANGDVWARKKKSLTGRKINKTDCASYSFSSLSDLHVLISRLELRFGIWGKASFWIPCLPDKASLRVLCCAVAGMPACVASEVI